MTEISNINNSTQKAERMKLIQQQIMLANTQTLLTKMTEKCFQKCINKPGSSLDSSEQKCVAMCMDRFMDSYNLVSRTLTNHIYRENSNLS